MLANTTLFDVWKMQIEKIKSNHCNPSDLFGDPVPSLTAQI